MAERLEWDTLEDHFLHKPFCDSIIWFHDSSMAAAILPSEALTRLQPAPSSLRTSSMLRHCSQFLICSNLPSSSMSNIHAFINYCPSCCQSPAWSKAPKSVEVSPCQNLFWSLSAAYGVFFLSKNFLKFIILISSIVKLNYDFQYILKKLCKTYEVTNWDI